MAFTLKVNGTAHSVAVNPDTIAAQVQGRALLGLRATRYGAITLNGECMEGSNLHRYRCMRMYEVSVVEPHIKSTGMLGELGGEPSACVTPAVTNVIFAVAGKRIRALPIDTSQLQS
jgi:isoquinoline 1-oxidoreductase subunit beta